jgi:membrane glycosyltransferase
LLPIMWFGHTVFIARLLTGRTVGWTAQARDDHSVPLTAALQQFWPQSLLGLWAVLVLALTVPAGIPYAFFIAGGPLLSIPLAMITSSPAVGRALVRIGLGRLPEETAPLPELRALALPAIEMTARAPRRL